MSCRILDFNVYSSYPESNSDEGSIKKDSSQFTIQMFGLDEHGKTYSVQVNGFKPFFFVLVSDSWTIKTKDQFLEHIRSKLGNYYSESITECILLNRKKLYGFDGGKEHQFLKFTFSDMQAFNKVKNFWYSVGASEAKNAVANGVASGAKTSERSEYKLLPNGYTFLGTQTRIYESNIPPLLRFFHLRDISPSGWISFDNKNTQKVANKNKTTTCDYEFITSSVYVKPLAKETPVPYKIASFDIEASSSHGDFPVPVKSYKKLATNIIEYFENNDVEKDDAKLVLTNIIHTAFGQGVREGLREGVRQDLASVIDLVYPINKDISCLDAWITAFFDYAVADAVDNDFVETATIESMFERMKAEFDEDDVPDYIKPNVLLRGKKMNIVDALYKLEREERLCKLNEALNKSFPKLEGDKVTFIGTTFMNYGDKSPSKNHCIVLNGAEPLANCELETYAEEKDVLLAWQRMIQRENPDIIIGYNIFGFDYEFMFRRAEETGCLEQFLKLSRNKDEVCAQKDRETRRYKMEEATLCIASGQHDLRYIKMNGRLQIDLYNFYRREENLSSYKLDFVAGHFIGDYVKSYEPNGVIKTTNMTGLQVGSYIHFEEIGHTIDYYDGGAKFQVSEIGTQQFTVLTNEGCPLNMDNVNKKVRWCLAKDDVTPKQIFQMTNGSDADRSLIAKYCLQDCNLVQYLFNKSDVLTGFIEMASICSVPVSFLVLRGQGIKLTSFVAKKCREKRTLIPVIDKGDMDDGYEGATVLKPKCDLYLDNPVACVDYASLYPSSMISENLSHDSKVWTKEYDMCGNLLEDKCFGEKDAAGNYKYDNLPGYEYVDITYDTYTYVRKSEKSAAIKVKCGHKVCRFAQFPDGKKAIMPSILEELLIARKTTRKQIPLQSDEFMKNVLDKRQLGYKVTANSLYGQCGAKTSTFYEQDIAACTTATGRLLLTYAKKVIEECYGDAICDTKKGPVLTKAEYIYGDSVAGYTPVYVRVNGLLEILTIEELASRYGIRNADTQCSVWTVCEEEGKETKEYCELRDVETWSDKGFTKLERVIRHKLAPTKRMMRIITNSGLVDVTDDHSLLLTNGQEISPTDVNLSTELLHHRLRPINNRNFISIPMAKLFGYFYSKGSCGKYLDPSSTDAPVKPVYKWSLNNVPSQIVLEYLTLCRNVYPQFTWKTIQIAEDQNKIYAVSKIGSGQDLTDFIKEYRSMIYDGRYKCVPSEILNSCESIRRAFVAGFNDSGVTEMMRQIDVAQIYWLTTSVMDYKVGCKVTEISELNVKGTEYVYDLTTENHHFAAGIGSLIVHNTDSVFFTFNLQTPEGKPIRGKEALEITIELAQEAGHLASSFLKGPHDLEYEKTFMPFCLLSKKRYVGMLYETDPNKGKRKEMGIVLKRRDNAPIVKDIYGGIIDILMKQQDVGQAVDFLKSSLKTIVDGACPMEKLIISKSLRSGYKNPKSIAHKVLADRITTRDPGNKPSSGDRIPFVYINTKSKTALQGDKIETPTFVTDHGLKIDYGFYITNQIMKPVQQLFALVLEQIWTLQKKPNKIRKYKQDLALLESKIDDEEKLEEKVEQLRNKEIKALLFDDYLRDIGNDAAGVQNIMTFFQKK